LYGRPGEIPNPADLILIINDPYADKIPEPKEKAEIRSEIDLKNPGNPVKYELKCLTEEQAYNVSDILLKQEICTRIDIKPGKNSIYRNE
jgi:hypothetical protein